MSKRVILLAFITIIAVTFSSVHAKEQLMEITSQTVNTEELKTTEKVAPAGRVRNAQRGSTTAPNMQAAPESTMEVAPLKARDLEIKTEPATMQEKGQNDKRAQLNGQWQMENTNWGLWIYYEFTGDDAEMTFDYSGPQGMWDISFRVISFDGTTVKLENKEDADEPVVTFNAKLNGQKLVVSNLGGTLHSTRLRHHNGTFAIVDE